MKKFNWPIRVYYEDTDAGGVLYHASYLKFMERARTECLRGAGFSQDALRQEDNIIFVVKAMDIKFHRPARLDDLLDIQTQIKKTGGASFVFAQEIFKDEHLLCQAQVRIACLNCNNGKPQSIPTRLKAKLNDVN